MGHSHHMPVLAIKPITSEVPTDTLVLPAADRTRLTKAIELLPQRERLVLGLFYFEELTVLEVAAVLDLEIREVLLHHAGAMILLRESLAHA